MQAEPENQEIKPDAQAEGEEGLNRDQVIDRIIERLEQERQTTTAICAFFATREEDGLKATVMQSSNPIADVAIAKYAQQRVENNFPAELLNLLKGAIGQG